jgi:hypothetical protein
VHLIADALCCAGYSQGGRYWEGERKEAVETHDVLALQAATLGACSGATAAAAAAAAAPAGAATWWPARSIAALAASR